ncbi:acetate---CoA ligase, partial [Synchytrium endobioticum]
MHRQVLWSPEPGTPSQLKSFQHFVENRHAQQFDNYDEFWQWSIDCLPDFWKDIWDYCQVAHSVPPSEIVEANKAMDEIPAWFSGARLNYAENMLRFRDNHIAIIATGEHLNSHTVTYSQLYDRVVKLATSLREANITVGDRIAAFLPNTEHAVICFLASTAVGAVFSSASPDFGVHGTLDRLGQIQPKLLFCIDSVFENGKHQCQVKKLEEIVAGLPSLQYVVFCPSEGVIHDTAFEIPRSSSLDRFLQLGSSTSEPFYFEQLPFDHPLVIMFTSGSTGKPKCLVHRAGGLLLQHRKEHLIHTSMSRQDKFFYYTTTGWMMWNWQVSALAEGATLVLFSGKPFLPTPAALFKIA